MLIHPPLIQKIIQEALLEDLGRSGDLTSQSILNPALRANASIVARKAGVIAGLPLSMEAFRQLDPAAKFCTALQDGAQVAAGATVLHIEAQAIALLAAERVALNFMCHLSGIATLTAEFVRAVAGTKAKIADTRKTTPLLRAFEKHAVRCGGGSNHRFGLDDAILIKDNHIAIAGGIKPALRAAKARAGHLVKIEIEVDTLAQLEEVLVENLAHPCVDVILLDNMPPEILRQAVTQIIAHPHRILSEASGGVNLDTVRAIAQSGVDLISIGALTHSAPILDLGLDIET
jgi:nicotinate-nucleotide pyrophosphorylase (carboxylating)